MAIVFKDFIHVTEYESLKRKGNSLNPRVKQTFCARHKRELTEAFAGLRNRYKIKLTSTRGSGYGTFEQSQV